MLADNNHEVVNDNTGNSQEDIGCNEWTNEQAELMEEYINEWFQDMVEECCTMGEGHDDWEELVGGRKLEEVDPKFNLGPRNFLSAWLGLTLGLCTRLSSSRGWVCRPSMVGKGSV